MSIQQRSKRFFELLVLMTERELRVRYKNTVFGFFWLVLNPLLQMIVIGFVFGFFVAEPITHYYYYLFIGLLTWNFFSLSLTKATPSIVFERALIKKSAFPRAVIPLSIVCSNAVHFLVAFALYTIPVLFLGTCSVSGILDIVAGLVLLFLFTIGMSLLTASLNVRFRDINFFVSAILIIWFYATPIVYSMSMIPVGMQWLWRLNPMTSVVGLLHHGFVATPMPEFLLVCANSAVILLVCILGIVVFQRENKNFDDWI